MSEDQLPPIEHCRSCDAEIRWVVSRAGRAMPIDAHPNGRGNLVLERHGVRWEAHVQKPAPFGEQVFISHFATCPDADAYRRPR